MDRRGAGESRLLGEALLRIVNPDPAGPFYSPYQVILKEEVEQWMGHVMELELRLLKARTTPAWFMLPMAATESDAP